MSSSLQEQLEQSLGEYRRKREELREMQARMAEFSVTVSSPRNVFSVTVGQQGEVTGLAFPTGAYKSLVPSELSKIILETVREAQGKARDELAALMEPMMPPGFGVRDLLAGGADLDAALPAEMEPGTFLRQNKPR